MSGPGPDASLLSLGFDQAANLRHDLVNPLSLVIGYCELLVAEASDLGLVANALVAPLGSIRRIALGLLTTIDRVLVVEQQGNSAEALHQLGDDLLGPALLLVHEADALLQSGAVGKPGGALADDLDKIRAAGAQLVVLIESLGSAPGVDA